MFLIIRVIEGEPYGVMVNQVEDRGIAEEILELRKGPGEQYIIVQTFENA